MDWEGMRGPYTKEKHMLELATVWYGMMTGDTL
jgi:hypothetical protein